MNVKKETCPKCGASVMENIFVVKKGSFPLVYVKCAKCGAFVARYTLECYTSDKSYKSLLTRLRCISWGSYRRNFLREIEGFSESVDEEFKKVQTELKNPDKRKIEEILIEEHNES